MAPPVKDISVKEFAELVGLTTVRIYQLVKEGMPHRKRKRGTRIVPRDSITWMLEKAAEAAKPKNEAPSARARLDLAQAELKELEVEERRKLLIPLDAFDTFVDALVGGFAAVAAGRLQRFERDIVIAASAPDARKVTERIHAALMEGAQEYADALDAQATVLSPPPASVLAAPAVASEPAA